jgi:hypothetical protein
MLTFGPPSLLSNKPSAMDSALRRRLLDRTAIAEIEGDPEWKPQEC